jgi:protein required for attachment to host cells
MFEDTQWILVAHRAGARIFQNTPGNRPLKLIQKLDNPDGRLKDHELKSDKPGVGFSSFSGDQSHHGMAEHTLPHQEVGRKFAHELVKILDQGRQKNDYKELILVADPWFLGQLRSAMGKETEKHVVSSISKDLAHIPDQEIKNYIQ